MSLADTIANMPADFRAVVTASLLNCRKARRGRSVGDVAVFAQKVREHQARFNTKLDGVLAQGGDPTAIATARSAISTFADSEVDRVTALGYVELATPDA